MLGGYDSLTVKPIASLTKNFSGCVILGLAQDGAFNLDDSIGCIFLMQQQWQSE